MCHPACTFFFADLQQGPRYAIKESSARPTTCAHSELQPHGPHMTISHMHRPATQLLEPPLLVLSDSKIDSWKIGLEQPAQQRTAESTEREVSLGTLYSS